MSDYDASEFESSDEHVPFYIDDDYLDEIHPPMTIDDMEEIEGYDSDYIEIAPDPDDLDAYQEMNID
jgi:hypothetical protein